MAFYFNCSTDYLLGRLPVGCMSALDKQVEQDLDWASRPLDEIDEEKKPTPGYGDGLNETEKKIMECVTQMPATEQDAFLLWLQS